MCGGAYFTTWVHSYDESYAQVHPDHFTRRRADASQFAMVAPGAARHRAATLPATRMSVAQYKFMSAALAILSLVLLVLWLVTLGQKNRHRADVRYAHDIVGGFQGWRDLALKAEPAGATGYLEQLAFPEGQPSPFSGSLSYFVETQRRRAVKDVIDYLRAKTGKDLGDKPEAWIKEYGRK
jgi:hypothetical protein